MKLQTFVDQMERSIAFRGSIPDNEFCHIRDDITREVTRLVSLSVRDYIMQRLEPKLEKILKEVLTHEELEK